MERSAHSSGHVATASSSSSRAGASSSRDWSRPAVYVPSWRVLQAMPVMACCVPYAGGTTATYRELSTHLQRHGLGCAVAVLPGRDGMPFANLSLAELAAGLSAYLPPGPTVLMGYSMGGLIAYEIARSLEPRRQRLAILACAAPGASRRDDAWTSGEIVSAIEDYGATPAELLRDPGFRRLLVDRLRHDFGLIDGYRPPLRPRLAVTAAMVLTGSDDRSTAGAQGLWSGHFQPSPLRRQLPGGHFFLHERPDAVAAALADLAHAQTTDLLQRRPSATRLGQNP
jgi:surfactin synthase thioesterase subunit